MNAENFLKDGKQSLSLRDGGWQWKKLSKIMQNA